MDLHPPLKPLSFMAERTDAAILFLDAQWRVVYANHGFSRMFGWLREEIAQQSLEMLVGLQRTTGAFARMGGELRTGRSVELEEVLVCRSGHRYWVKMICNPVMDDDGRWRYTVAVILDITLSKMHEVLNNRVLEAMARDLPLMDVLAMVCEEVEGIAPDISASILEVDDKGVLHPLASPSLPHSYSSQLDGVVIGPNVGSCGSAAWFREPVLVTDIATDPRWADYKHLILPLGYTCCWSNPILNKDGRVQGTFAFYYRENGPRVASPFHHQLVRACTHLCALAMERERTRKRIRHLALYDALTGLPNRRLFLSNAEKVLQTVLHKGQRAAILFIDLDRFKHVNDSLGHGAGDELLCVISERIRSLLHYGGTSGRLSGDEFVMVLPESDSERIDLTIERLQTALMQPLRLQDIRFDVSVSIGVAMFPDDGLEMENLLHLADIAMYQAKNAGWGSFRFFSSEMNQIAQERLLMESALRQALLNPDGSLHLHYQPQIEMETGQVYGVEALARWRDASLGDIPPVRFIQLAEESGLVGLLGQWAVREACRQLGQWRAEGLQVPNVSVNLSPLNFHDLALPCVIAEALKRNGLQPADLILEITESLLLDTHESTMKNIEILHAQGVRLSMDDFGSGYSGLNYLRRLPVSELKLDRSFVADLESDEAARALSGAILGVGQSLGLTVVAEGVETAAQYDVLRGQGYPVAQGYLFARPLSASDLEQWLLERGPRLPPSRHA